jgi:phosphoglycolate phosphatase-like HAD superfamily hydrolase
MSFEAKKAVLFDLDGTLVESFKTNPLPDVAQLLEDIRAHQIPMGVATNQAGPLWRAVTGQTKYPTVETVAANLRTIAHTLKLEHDLWIVSIWDDRAVKLVESEDHLKEIASGLQRQFLDVLLPVIPKIMVSFDPTDRKPQPGMLNKARAEWKIENPDNFYYVGDMETDKQAAEHAGVQYLLGGASTMFWLIRDVLYAADEWDAQEGTQG